MSAAIKHDFPLLSGATIFSSIFKCSNTMCYSTPTERQECKKNIPISVHNIERSFSFMKPLTVIKNSLLIVTSSAIDKKLENRLEIDKKTRK